MHFWMMEAAHLRQFEGRPLVDAIIMFSILVLQSRYNLGDDVPEYLIRDCLSFRWFMELCLADKGRV